jgi:hypothetical protein
MGEVGCLRGELDATMFELKMTEPEDIAARRNLAREAVQIRVALARAWERMLTLQISVIDTPGELGTLANLEQHSRRFLGFLTAHDEAICNVLGTPMPKQCELSSAYTGPARIIVPTVRTAGDTGERLALMVILLAPSAPGDSSRRQSGTLLWRPIGAGEFQKVDLTHVARSVYRVELPPLPADAVAIEYYIEAQAGSERLLFPASAPRLNQTVVVKPGS